VGFCGLDVKQEEEWKNAWSLAKEFFGGPVQVMGHFRVQIIGHFRVQVRDHLVVSNRCFWTIKVT
jgi:hypothetical protein